MRLTGLPDPLGKGETLGALPPPEGFPVGVTPAPGSAGDVEDRDEAGEERAVLADELVTFGGMPLAQGFDLRGVPLREPRAGEGGFGASTRPHVLAALAEALAQTLRLKAAPAGEGDEERFERAVLAALVLFELREEAGLEVLRARGALKIEIDDLGVALAVAASGIDHGIVDHALGIARRGGGDFLRSRAVNAAIDVLGAGTDMDLRRPL